jgi:hypothetical protein
VPKVRCGHEVSGSFLSARSGRSAPDSDFVLRYDPDVIAVIEDPDQLKRILRYPGRRAEQQPEAATRLIKIGRSPPGFDPIRLN